MNNLDNKEKFFAQYYNQNILISHNIGKFKCITEWGTISDAEYLELKPLSSITDEDAAEAGKYESDIYQLEWSLDEKSRFGRMVITTFIHKKKVMNLPSILIDYLRSKGYALPWNGITVEQQIEYGWIKLKE